MNPFLLHCSGESWSIGALLPDGLANKRSFFGSSRSCLFALKPTFKALRATSESFGELEV